MPTKTFYSKLLLVAIFLTLAAIAGKSLLPERTLIISPLTPNANYFLLPVNNDPDHKKAYWVHNQPFHFHCSFTAEDQYAPCNMIYMFSNDITHGIDISKYRYLNIVVNYKGNAKALRLSMRNFDPRFSVKENDNSAKFNYINLRTRDLNKPLRINLREFVVADWWISQFDLPREFIQPELNNVFTFSVDFPDDLRNSEHDIDITHIEFSGDWISNEHWYLGILSAWMLFGTLFAITRLIQLHQIEKLNQQKISTLVESNYQLRRETDKFRKLSTVDALTNAFNRHGIEQIIESLEINSETTAVIMIDIDHFKRINDRRGHDAGDRVLQTISSIVMKATRNSDKFGRWGGEEFVLICPNTSVAMALALAEKLRILIFDALFEPDNPLAVTASFGVASVSRTEPFSVALKHADEALYRAKAMGRNCVVVAEQDDAVMDLFNKQDAQPHL